MGHEVLTTLCTMPGGAMIPLLTIIVPSGENQGQKCGDQRSHAVVYSEPVAVQEMQEPRPRQARKCRPPVWSPATADKGTND